ncbi:S-adenosyl-L-methionine-dependent methyltransferase [Mucor lusitanicus]|uniref:S-adenosyl-L-methionine-dependent methyltransferase n=2 Tax=Mucor circinelloides f. lusitanicus TaxID=29924 RepID=A0A8H4BSB7_MUCCL|nr:S-adenosyl-L-methionine-dependent methyltransferase [Mucor lusitanicus]
MFKLVSSIIDSVFGRKRPLDVDDEDEIVEQQKKQKLEMTHRIKVTNLPVRELPAVKKFFKKLGYNRIKKAPEWDFGFITVDSEEEAQKCLEVVNSSTFKNRQLAGEYITETVQEHRDKFMSGNRGGKKGKKNQPMADDKDDTRTPAEKLADQVTPLWREPYDVQLVKKNRNGTKQLMNLKRKIQGLKDVRDESQRAWAFEKGSLPCEVLDPIPSPEINGYRTKCEFTIGKNLDGEPTVGFLLGLYRDGITSVLEPSECLNVSDTAKHIARVFGDYVRKSDLPVYDRVEKTGCWRTLMTKTQSTGDVLILVQLRAADLTPERLEQEKKNLIQFWTQESGINVTTLIFQVWDGNSNGITDKAPMETLTGDGYIYENVLGCRFRLSASAFFQVNTPAAELLYAKCAEWCSIDANKKTTLLDLCCGTGTIGITMARSVDRVVGIEMVPEAIVDAKANAKLNNIENVTYYANKVEDKIDVVTGEKNEEVIAVLDPPRNGVHASVIRAVRDAEHIDRVVYISCDAKQALDNFVTLCRPQSNRFRGMPFKPTRAISVDLFPHTDHCELMIEFVRQKPDQDS